MKDKRNLLVTLADENYVEQAKQLFSSVYWNAGWKGDYMLLSHEIPEKKLKWFREKGILIKKCKSFLGIKKLKSFPSTILDKFYLFTPYFKKWKNVVFLDADMIVRASLEELTKVNNFAAVLDVQKPKLINQLTNLEKKKDTINKLKKEYDLEENVFNSGVMAFNTNIIKKRDYLEITKLFKETEKVNSLFVEQVVLSFFFYKNFTALPYIYNCCPAYTTHSCNIRPEKIKGIVLHFMDQYKPWLTKNPFYKEWKNNLEKAEFIDLKKIPTAKEKWTKEDIEKYCRYLRKRHIFYFHKYIIWKISIFIDRNIGLLGIFLRKHYLKLYFKLKKLKKEK